ncbi:hypothetical protein [Moumouvirus maliensis]|nr:hypothetical protein [Moumouvirus maliensis]
MTNNILSMVKINYIDLERTNYNSILIELLNNLHKNNHVKKYIKINILMKSNIYDDKYNDLGKNISQNSKKYFDCEISNYFYYVYKIKNINELVKFLQRDSQTSLNSHLWKKISIKLEDLKIIFRSRSINIKTKNNPPQNIQEIEDYVRNIFICHINCKHIKNM